MFNLVKGGFKGHHGPRVHKQNWSSDGVLQVLTEPQVVHERLESNGNRKHCSKQPQPATDWRWSESSWILTETMAVGIMAPPVEPITKILDGDFSTEGAMEDGGRSPEKKERKPSSEMLRERNSAETGSRF